jgi:hypothetical protein
MFYERQHPHGDEGNRGRKQAADIWVERAARVGLV